MPLHYRLINNICNYEKSYYVLYSNLCIVLCSWNTVWLTWLYELQSVKQDWNCKSKDAALKAADKVMDNNQLFDTDGSDAMVDYLNKASVVDSLNKLEQ